jgi:hypothetical protein
MVKFEPLFGCGSFIKIIDQMKFFKIVHRSGWHLKYDDFLEIFQRVNILKLDASTPKLTQSIDHSKFI